MRAKTAAERVQKEIFKTIKAGTKAAEAYKNTRELMQTLFGQVEIDKTATVPELSYSHIQEVGKGIKKRGAEICARMYAQEIGIDYEELLKIKVAAEAIEIAGYTGELNALIEILENSIDVGELRKELSRKAAKKILSWQTNANEGKKFYSWEHEAKMGKEKKKVYSYETALIATETIKGLERFMEDRTESLRIGMESYIARGLHQVSQAPLEHGAETILFSTLLHNENGKTIFSEGKITVVTFKTKIEYRIYGSSLIKDFLQWLEKYGE